MTIKDANLERANLLADIVKIKDISSIRDNDVNKHLDHGWVILGQNQFQTGPNDICTSFVLGWSASKGKESEPPRKTNCDVELEKWFNEGNDLDV